MESRTTSLVSVKAAVKEAERKSAQTKTKSKNKNYAVTRRRTCTVYWNWYRGIQSNCTSLSRCLVAQGPKTSKKHPILRPCFLPYQNPCASTPVLIVGIGTYILRLLDPISTIDEGSLPASHSGLPWLDTQTELCEQQVHRL